MNDGWIGFLCSTEGTWFLMQTSIALLFTVNALRVLEKKVFGTTAKHED